MEASRFIKGQNSSVVFWPQAAEAGFQNPSPLGEGSGPSAAKRVWPNGQGSKRAGVMAVTGGAA